MSEATAAALMLYILSQPAHPGCSPTATVATLQDGCSLTITVKGSGVTRLIGREAGRGGTKHEDRERLLRLGEGVSAS